MSHLLDDSQLQKLTEKSPRNHYSVWIVSIEISGNRFAYAWRIENKETAASDGGFEIFGNSVPESTIYAAVKALEHVPASSRVRIFTTQKFLRDLINDGLDTLAGRGFCRRSKPTKLYANARYLKQLADIVDRRQLKISAERPVKSELYEFSRMKSELKTRFQKHFQITADR